MRHAEKLTKCKWINWSLSRFSHWNRNHLIILFGSFRSLGWSFAIVVRSDNLQLSMHYFVCRLSRLLFFSHLQFHNRINLCPSTFFFFFWIFFDLFLSLLASLSIFPFICLGVCSIVRFFHRKHSVLSQKWQKCAIVYFHFLSFFIVCLSRRHSNEMFCMKYIEWIFVPQTFKYVFHCSLEKNKRKMDEFLRWFR